MEFEYSNGHVSRVCLVFFWSSLYGCFLLLPLISVKCLIFCHRPVKSLPQGLHLMVDKDAVFWSPDLMNGRGERLACYLELLFEHSPAKFWMLWKTSCCWTMHSFIQQALRGLWCCSMLYALKETWRETDEQPLHVVRSMKIEVCAKWHQLWKHRQGNHDLLVGTWGPGMAAPRRWHLSWVLWTM